MELSKHRVLIVDDDMDTRDIYHEFLNEDGIDVDLAVDGDDGLKKILSEKYDLIILDIMMPKMDGLQILEKIQALPADNPAKQAKIVIFSALDQPHIIEKAKRLGAKGFLSKSNLNPDQALRQIKAYLNSSN